MIASCSRVRWLVVAVASLAIGCGGAGAKSPDGGVGSDGGDGAMGPDAAVPVPVPVIMAPPLNGTFVEVPGVAPLSWPPLDPNLEMDPASSGGLIVDLDGDGVNEVVITQYPTSGGGTSVVYRYDGTRLVPAPDLVLPRSDGLVAAMDMDGDGALDLVFNDEVYFGGARGYEPSRVPPIGYPVAAIWDIDGDDLPDLLAAPFCSTPRIALQPTRRGFEAAPSLIVAGGNVNANAGFVGIVDDVLLLGTVGPACAGNEVDVPIFYRKRAGASVFESMDIAPGVSFTKGSAMGVTTGADLDGDGHFDLIASLSPQHVLISNGKESRQSFYNVRSPTTGKEFIPWTTLLLDVDLDGRTDVLFSHGTDNVLSQFRAGIGKEFATAHWNSGEGFGRFPSLGDLDRPGEWRILGVGDLEGDGDADIILGGFGEDPHVYRNDIRGNGVSLRLVTKRGTPAWGAKLTLTAATTQRFQVSGIGTQRQVSWPLVFAGLGAATEGRVDVTWPDGSQQTETVRAGRLWEIRQKP